LHPVEGKVALLEIHAHEVDELDKKVVIFGGTDGVAFALVPEERRGGRRAAGG